MKIALLSRYERSGSSSRLRSYQYLPWLAERGIETAAFPLLSDSYLARLYAGDGTDRFAVAAGYAKRMSALLRVGRFDAVWLEREALPFAPGWFDTLLLRARGIPYVVDYDDAVFHDYDRHRSRAVRALLGGKIDRVMRDAETVIVGNEYIRQRAVQAGARKVKLLPTVVDLSRYRLKDEPSPTFTVGWIGTPITAKFLSIVRGALRQVCADGRGRFLATGAGSLQMPDVPLEVAPWTEQQEAESIRACDVGIMPLFDGEQERGKCGYKLIQYMACGLPVVASPVGMNAHLVVHGENGYLASNEKEWVDALSRLRNDPALRQRMGAAGRRLVEAEYSIPATVDRLADVLRGAVNTGKSRVRRVVPTYLP
ncbi:MAG TPA: glycosyltransferase family 4 protein [Bryobacteraceae bacterium]|nr:glycosyltransferase family 4 protein [Bryobacteraceae bacterium]